MKKIEKVMPLIYKYHDKEMTDAEYSLMKFANVFSEAIIHERGGCILHNDDTMTKIIDGVAVRKQSATRKDWSHDWIENIKIEDIDDRYFNKDYTRKN